MKQSAAKIERKYGAKSLTRILKEKLKSKRFRKAFTEEMSRLELVHSLQTLRKGRGLTQKDVADRARMPQSVVARIESGSHRFSIATLHRVASVYDKRIALVD